MMYFILLTFVLVLFLIMIFSICTTASRADAEAERIFREKIGKEFEYKDRKEN